MASAAKVSKGLGLDFGLKSEEESLCSGDDVRSTERRDCVSHQLRETEATLDRHLNSLTMDLGNHKGTKHFRWVYSPAPIYRGKVGTDSA